MDKLAPGIGRPLDDGTVMSVNGKWPQANGNVILPIGLTHVNGEKAPPNISAIENPPNDAPHARVSEAWQKIQPLDEGEY